MAKKKKDYNVTTASEVVTLIKNELGPIFESRYFSVEFKTHPYKRLSIVLYNGDKRALPWQIGYSGNIAATITGFTDDNKVSSAMCFEVLKSWEIDSVMNINTKNGDINNVLRYVLSKFKNVDLAKVTDYTKHMVFDENGVVKPHGMPAIDEAIIDDIEVAQRHPLRDIQKSIEKDQIEAEKKESKEEIKWSEEDKKTYEKAINEDINKPKKKIIKSGRLI